MKKLSVFFVLLLIICTACAEVRPSAELEPRRSPDTERKYDSALSAYGTFLDAYEPAPPEEEDEEQEVAAALIYLDDDDVPELAVADGKEPWNPVRLFRYNADAEKVEEIGSFSMYGQMYYMERSGFLLPMYFLSPMNGEVLLYRSGVFEIHESWEMDGNNVPFVNGEAVSEDRYTAVSERWICADWTPVFEEGKEWQIEVFPRQR